MPDKINSRVNISNIQNPSIPQTKKTEAEFKQELGLDALGTGYIGRSLVTKRATLDDLINEVNFPEDITNAMWGENDRDTIISTLKERLAESKDKIEANPKLFKGVLERDFKARAEIPYNYSISNIIENVDLFIHNETCQKYPDIALTLYNMEDEYGCYLSGVNTTAFLDDITKFVPEVAKHPHLFDIAKDVPLSSIEDISKFVDKAKDIEPEDVKFVTDFAANNKEVYSNLKSITPLLDDVDTMRQNPELLETLLSTKGTTGLTREKIHQSMRVQDTTHNMAEVLKLAQKYPKVIDKIYLTAMAMSEPKNSEIIEFITSDDFDEILPQYSAGKYQKEIISALHPKNLSAKDLMKLIDSGISKEDYLNGLKKMSKSTFKLAYQTPNQYLSDLDIEYTKPINGKLPKIEGTELLIQQSQVTQFFQENLVTLCRALKYLDTDTISHMMDKRMESFTESLNDLDNLSDENFELLSKLTQLRSSVTGKPLSPKQKMQMCHIVEIFQSANIDTSILKSSVEKGEIDINVPKQIIQKKIVENADIHSTDEDNLKFNEEYGYLALVNPTEKIINTNPYIKMSIDMMKEQFIKLKYDKQERINYINKEQNNLNKYGGIFTPEQLEDNKNMLAMLENLDNAPLSDLLESAKKTIISSALGRSIQNKELDNVIKASVLHDFKDYITDESNHYGQTNAKTRLDFESAGLDYDKWLNPDIDSIEFSAAGKDMSIRMWDRNPQEDLFIGNKTTCCTAIGTGGNASATPLYLLNTSFNVVQLFDKNDNMVGMSRVFMANVDDKPSLIMDNIELNKTFIKDMTDDERKQIRDGFFRYMNKYAQQITGDKNPVVYMYSGDTGGRYPIEDLDIENKEADFIGKCSQEQVYVNSASCRWIDPTKLKDEGKIKWLIAANKEVENERDS